MVRFNAVIKRFASQGEKTGWTYIEIPATIAVQLKARSKKTFRVKGRLDKHKIEMVSLLPMGQGVFILTLNKEMRKAINKPLGATISINISEDKREVQLDEELMICMNDEPDALQQFNKLTPSHQRYFSKWISDAKTQETKSIRIAKTINAMLNKLSFGEMLKSRE